MTWRGRPARRIRQTTSAGSSDARCEDSSEGKCSSGAEGLVAGGGGREDVPADQRRICGDCDCSGLGAGGPQSVSSGGPAVDFSEESAAHFGAGGTAKAGATLGA